MTLQQQQPQHQGGDRPTALLNSRPLRGDVTNTALSSQVTNREHSTDNIQAHDVIIPGGAAL